MLGIAIGVTALITVLSVMNGFNKEIRAKMLNITPHIILRGYNSAIFNWQKIMPQIMAEPGVVGAAPYIISQDLLVANGVSFPSLVRGIDPKIINDVFPLRNNIKEGSLDKLLPGTFNIAIGKDLANAMDVKLHDKITVLMPEATVTMAGVVPKYKRMNIAAIFDTGTSFDDRNAFININDASKMFKMNNGITGIQIKVHDELDAPNIAKSLRARFDNKYQAIDWASEHANFFDALNMEKTVMWCILCLIIAVAAFNLVSSLVMMVTDKRSDIAILRTMGATPADVMGIFVTQGAIIGLFGTLLGLVFGLLLATHITGIVEYIQSLLNVKFVSEDVYLIGFVPSHIKQSDVLLVCAVSFIMSLLATIYPAWRASSIAPVEALRYE